MLIVYTWGSRTPDWIFAQPYTDLVPGDTEVTDNGWYGHGTCSTDLAVGAINGIAKRADITVIKHDDATSDFIATFQLEKYIDALSQILDDLIRRGITRAAVVLMPWGFDSLEEEEANFSASHFEAFWNEMFKILMAIDARGTALVAASGNHQSCRGPPCIFGKPGNPDYIPDMIVVGARDILDGSYASNEPEARENWYTIYGPAVDGVTSADRLGFECADAVGDTGGISPFNFHGTSAGKHIRLRLQTAMLTYAASSLVAGMVATWKSMYPGWTTTNVISLMQNLAYARDDNGPKMPWLGCDLDTCDHMSSYDIGS